MLAFSTRDCSLDFLSLGVPFVAICRAGFIFFFRVSSEGFLSLVILLISAILRAHLFLFISGIFHGSFSTVLFFFLVLLFLALSI